MTDDKTPIQQITRATQSAPQSSVSTDRVLASFEKGYRQPSDPSEKPWTITAVMGSPITIALAFLLLLNAALLILRPVQNVDPKALPATHTWTWWAATEYFATAPAPPVVLVGSSLFMHPVSRQDADYLNTDFDYVRHHRSKYMEDILRTRFGAEKNTAVFNFALPGDLISDDYLIVKTILAQKDKPRYIILGLSLRDFIDNAVNCPGTTPPFRYLKRFTNIDDIVDLALPKFWQQFEYRFGQIFYLWQNKLDIQVVLDDFTKRTITPIIAKLSSPSRLNELDFRHHVPANLHSEVEEGMAIVKAHQPYSYDPNFADYQRRCGKPNLEMFEIQSKFFQKILSMCKTQNVKVIVLNMPLTSDNLNLMPPGSYDRYLQRVVAETAANGSTFVDLNQDKKFVKSDFYDTAHMNSTGGKKLIETISTLQSLDI
jgi:hypothetical protein